MSAVQYTHSKFLNLRCYRVLDTLNFVLIVLAFEELLDPLLFCKGFAFRCYWYEISVHRETNVSGYLASTNDLR
jgi:hypothetical protein